MPGDGGEHRIAPDQSAGPGLLGKQVSGLLEQRHRSIDHRTSHPSSGSASDVGTSVATNLSRRATMPLTIEWTSDSRLALSHSGVEPASRYVIVPAFRGGATVMGGVFNHDEDGTRATRATTKPRMVSPGLDSK